MSLLNCVYLSVYNSLAECVCTVALHSFVMSAEITRFPLLFPQRDSVMEILFEQDNEEKSVASLILDALVKVAEKSSMCYVFGTGEGNMSLTCYELKMRCTSVISYHQGRNNRNISVNVLISILLQAFGIFCREECRVPVFPLHTVQRGNQVHSLT